MVVGINTNLCTKTSLVQTAARATDWLWPPATPSSSSYAASRTDLCSQNSRCSLDAGAHSQFWQQVKHLTGHELVTAHTLRNRHAHTKHTHILYVTYMTCCAASNLGGCRTQHQITCKLQLHMTGACPAAGQVPEWQRSAATRKGCMLFNLSNLLHPAIVHRTRVPAGNVQAVQDTLASGWQAAAAACKKSCSTS